MCKATLVRGLIDPTAHEVEKAIAAELLGYFSIAFALLGANGVLPAPALLEGPVKLALGQSEAVTVEKLLPAVFVAVDDASPAFRHLRCTAEVTGGQIGEDVQC
ncbi:Uu.00g065820.m01.CDS01 [Anthostomella pinea]|uniref:Uu.00g065820.m01.CDS01 n=1 Tax=Anthostomella pinea TaxID=933095 RepID=A0AAI8VTS5_9PEZI|nr:Uu.00g065820.m01.CDS01 [Anthostomella pinea]